MKKWLSVILALTLIALMLTGCGGNSTAADGGAMGNVAGDKVVAEPETGSTGSGTATAIPESQKMVYKVWLETETEDLGALLANVESQIAAADGYIESQNQRNGSKYAGSRRYRYADLTIRIPTGQLDSFVSKVGESTNIISKKQTAENITLSYVATESRVTALETEQTRLLELLAKAESMSDILEIQKRLTEVRTELEKHASQLRVYDNLVDYATVYLTVSEVTEYTDTQEPETVWDRIGKGFMESLENLGNFFVELFVFVIVALPYLIPLGLAVTGIILLIRHKKKKTPPKTDA